MLVLFAVARSTTTQAAGFINHVSLGVENHRPFLLCWRLPMARSTLLLSPGRCVHFHATGRAPPLCRTLYNWSVLPPPSERFSRLIGIRTAICSPPTSVMLSTVIAGRAGLHGTALWPGWLPGIRWRAYRVAHSGHARDLYRCTYT